MSNIVSFKKKYEGTQTASGEAFCIGCNHIWVAVADTGITDLECPNCLTYKGKFKFEFKVDEGQFVRECNCGNKLFYITPDGHLCPNCGIYQSY